MTAKDPATDEILIRRTGAQSQVGHITLNRPKQLNALNYTQVIAISAALDTWETDPSLAVVLIDGAGERGLCAGGDIRAMYDHRTDGAAAARKFWADEYRMNSRLSRYKKPIVPIMDGIVMGGGIGLSAHCTHRATTEKSVLAMPETTIGMIPDVGGTWLLTRKPQTTGLSKETGTYLALTSGRFNGSEAVDLGFANVCVPTHRLPRMLADILDGEAPDGALIRANGSVDELPETTLDRFAEEIDRCFGFDDVEDILEALDRRGTPWAGETAATIRQRSPLAVKLALAALRRARGLPSLEEALKMEYRLVVRLFDCGEFVEGVRALIVDKDKAPKWRPATLKDVSPKMVEEFLSPLPPGEELQIPFPAA